MIIPLPTLCPPPPADFPKVQFKAQPEDFIVEEIPLYEPCGSGTHTYLWIEKRGLNTMDAVRRLAAALGKRAADAGVAGLKDAQAVSRQWISFEHVTQIANLRDDPNLRVLKVSAHSNKLRMGHLRGNRFQIRLRVTEPLTPDPSPARGEGSTTPHASLLIRAREALAVLTARGVPNYYGAQRFGRHGDNAEFGRMLVRGETAAFDAAFKNAPRKPDRKLRNLLVNAFQSELFNRVLALRMPEIGRLQAGDLAWLHRNGAVFAVADDAAAALEQPRADAFEISPSGPIFGAKTKLAEGVPGEIERRVLAEAGVTLEDFGRREAERQPGARRPLRAPFLEPPAVTEDSSGVLLCFALPSGSYATVVLREIVGVSGDA